MKLKLIRPSEDYPLAWIYVDLKTDLEGRGLVDILAKRKLTLLGRWEVHTKNDVSEFRAPVLIEDDHVKPRALRRR